MAEKNYFAELYAVNVSDKIEKKNGLSYVSWPYAWAEVKKLYPDSTFTIYERDTEFGPVNYFTDGKTCWVKTGVTVNGIEHIEELPVMDFRNNSIPLNGITSMAVNKTIQRSLTKACARHGLGLYVYAGEDLPEGGTDDLKEVAKATDPTYDTEKKARKEQINFISNALEPERLAKMLEYYNINSIEELTSLQAGDIMNKLKEHK